MTDLRSGIIETARSLGMDPAVLATIMSYETGGTFDYRKKGPTTQYGQHEGLIQFGQPQQQQYGVDWSKPFGNQLGPDGAVARYFKNNGYQPGMGILDAYSIVNAGAPGRYNASDANNGGAPGTVSDKVNNQMAGHWANAMKLIGGNLSYGLPSAQASAMPLNMGTPAQKPNIYGVLGGILSQPTQREEQPQFAQLLPTQSKPYTPRRR